MDDDEKADRRGIQSVEIAVAVLDALRRGGGAMTLKDLARAAGLPPSNCHRYLVSLTRTGFVVQDDRNGRYDLGPALLQAGLSALGRLDTVGIATNALQQLVDDTGHSGLVAIWAEAGPTIIRWMQGRLAVRTTLAPGATLPLLGSATGRLFLAFLPERQVSTLFALEENGADVDVEQLIAATRAAGFARVSGDHIPGLNAVAAPILDAAGEAAAVLTLVSAGRPISMQATDQLLAHARQASAQLGWTAATPNMIV